LDKQKSGGLKKVFSGRSLDIFFGDSFLHVLQQCKLHVGSHSADRKHVSILIAATASIGLKKRK
jgi:hypothetical protein